MKKKYKVLIVVGIIAVIIVALFASGILTFKATINRTEDKVKVKEPLVSETAEFKSRYGFTVTYPKNWIVNDSQKDTQVEYINEPSGKAIVAIQIMNDDRLKTPALRGQVLKEAEDAFKKDKTHTLNTFEWAPAEEGTNDDSYMATGFFDDKNGVAWLFREIAVFNPSSAIFFLRGNVLVESAKEYGPIIDKIIFSFRPTNMINITIESARERVEILSEVVEYKKMLVKTGKQATIEVEDGDDVWNVHVFEIVKEANGASHTATFGWYTVDKKTGVVEKGI